MVRSAIPLESSALEILDVDPSLRSFLILLAMYSSLFPRICGITTFQFSSGECRVEKALDSTLSAVITPRNAWSKFTGEAAFPAMVIHVAASVIHLGVTISSTSASYLIARKILSTLFLSEVSWSSRNLCVLDTGCAGASAFWICGDTSRFVGLLI